MRVCVCFYDIVLSDVVMFDIHYMDKSIRTPDHYTNRDCNDIVFKYIYMYEL